MRILVGPDIHSEPPSTSTPPHRAPGPATTFAEQGPLDQGHGTARPLVAGPRNKDTCCCCPAPARLSALEMESLDQRWQRAEERLPSSIQIGRKTSVG